MSKTDLAKVPVFILAGGLGTRLSEETTLKPKPMVEIGDVPILVHLMRWYYSFGFNDFVICAGYKSWEVKSFFLNYEFRVNHVAIDHRTAAHEPAFAHGRNVAQEKWRVRVIDTGNDTMTGGRVARALDEVCEQDQFENFALTYGDGLSDVDLAKQFDFHQSHDQIGTVLGVRPTARWGEFDIVDDHRVTAFVEKPESRQPWVNGGFFFMKRKFRDYLKTDPSCVLEKSPVADLASDGQLHVYKHTGFWHPMDTLRDKMYLQELWEKGKAPWRAKA